MSPEPESTTAMITASSRKPTRQREQGGEKAADQGSDCGADGGRCTGQGVDLDLGLALEVAVDQRLHRRKLEGGTKATDHCPEDDDRRKVLGDRHRDGT